MIKRVDNTIEIDFCLGSLFKNGIITTRSCCEAEQFFLSDNENSSGLDIDIQSVFIENKICFINITNEFNPGHPVFDKISSCSILVSDHNLDDYVEIMIDIENRSCSNRTCYLNHDLSKHETILNGTPITCQNSSIYGIIVKCQLLWI